MHPFSTFWKYKKTTVFWCFEGVEKGCIGNKWVNKRYRCFPFNFDKSFSTYFLPKIFVWLARESLKVTTEKRFLSLIRAVKIFISWKQVCGNNKYKKLPWRKVQKQFPADVQEKSYPEKFRKIHGTTLMSEFLF